MYISRFVMYEYAKYILVCIRTVFYLWCSVISVIQCYQYRHIVYTRYNHIAYICTYIYIYIHIRLHIPYIALMNESSDWDWQARKGWPHWGTAQHTGYTLDGCRDGASNKWLLGCFICCCQWLNIIECRCGMGNCVWETTPSDEWEHILYIHIYIYIYST